MSATTQVNVLRAIQERQIVRVSGETVIPVNIRLACATHRDLKSHSGKMEIPRGSLLNHWRLSFG